MRASTGLLAIMDRVGKYEIVKELGHGATSTVYLALDPFNQQQVALKVFNLEALHDVNRAKAFPKLLLTEASLAGRLSHPHIVKIIDAVMEGDAVRGAVERRVEITPVADGETAALEHHDLLGRARRLGDGRLEVRGVRAGAAPTQDLVHQGPGAGAVASRRCARRALRRRRPRLEFG